MADANAVEFPCPRCGSETNFMPACHTWRNSQGQWMSCVPCDTATDHYCTSDDCDWWFTNGLNPHNPRAALNEKARPVWLGGEPVDGLSDHA